MIVRSRSPLRVGLAGGGTDVSPFCDLYGGLVLNATINLFAYATAEKRQDELVRLIATDRMESYQGKAEMELPDDGCLILHKGVYRRMMREFNQGAGMSLTLTTHSDVPPGSGLGSSSTLVVAMVQAFSELMRIPLGEYDVARIAYEIERTEIGLSGGRQDQYAAAFGGFNFMEFYENDRVIVNPLRIKNSTITELEASLLLAYTGNTRESASIIEKQKANIERGCVQSVEAMKRLKDEAIAMKEALLTGEIGKLTQVLNEGWESKKKTANGISNPRIDQISRLALEAGAYAGKVSGAGGGGFMFFLVDPPAKPGISILLQSHGCTVMNCHFTKKGVEAWTVANRQGEFCQR